MFRWWWLLLLLFLGQFLVTFSIDDFLSTLLLTLVLLRISFSFLFFLFFHEHPGDFFGDGHPYFHLDIFLSDW